MISKKIWQYLFFVNKLSLLLILPFQLIYGSDIETKPFLAKNALFLEEDSKKSENWRQPSDIPLDSKWQSLPDAVNNFGFTKKIIWIKISAENRSKNHQFLIWYFNTYRLLDFKIYESISGSDFHSFQSGAKVSYSDRRDPCQGFCHSFDISPNIEKEFYFRFASDTAIRLKPVLMKESDFRISESQASIFLGVYYGFLLAMIIYTAVAYREIKNTLFSTYVIAVATVLLYYLVFDGQLQKFFLVDYPEYQHRWLSSFGIGYSGSYILFVTTFSKLKYKAPWLFKFNSFYIAISFLISLGGLTVIPNTFMNKLALNWNIVSILVGAVSVIVGANFKVISGRRFFYGNLSVLVSGTIFILWWKGLLPSNLFTLHSLRIGTVFELIFFALALGSTIGELDNQRRSSLQLATVRTNFATTLSHEIRTPVTAIIGMTEILASTDLKDNQKNIVSSIQSASKFLHSLVNDVLTFTKLDSLNVNINEAPFQLSELLRDIDSLFKMRMDEKKINFTILNKCPEDLSILSDKDKITQILVNLIGNAIKFTPEGGRIDLHSFYKESSDMYILEFDIKDTGIGIPNDMLTEIFEEYKQASDTTSKNFGGTGLGLPISKKICELLNGAINVQSVLGEGSTFRVSLNVKPYLEEIPVESDNLIQSFKSINKSLQILHIDDQEEIRMLFKFFFESSPHNLTSKSNAKSALLNYNQNHYDFVFCDYHMPEMNGLDFFKEIDVIDSDLNRKSPVKVFLTGSLSNVELAKKSRFPSVVDEVLLKPFFKRDLYSLIVRHLK